MCICIMIETYIYTYIILRLRPCRRPLWQPVDCGFADLMDLKDFRIEIIGKFSNCIILFKQISFILLHRFIDF